MLNKTFLRDVAERAVSTYLQAFVGLLIAGTFTLNIDSVKAAGIAAIPAALSVLKSALASRIGDKDSASLDPTIGVVPISD